MTDYLRLAREELTAENGPFALTDISVRGIAMKKYATAPADLRALWQMTAGYGDRDYLVFEDERFTYSEVHAQVRALAHTLHTVHGVGPGDRVALSMRNYPEWVVAYWATVSIGAAVVGMNAWWTSSEMSYGLQDSQPKVVIVDDERLTRLLPVLDDLRSTAPLQVIAVRSAQTLPSGANSWSDALAAGNGREMPAVAIDTDDDACIFYTSGTTGFPKGAQITHLGSITNLFNIAVMNISVAMADAKAAATAQEASASPTSGAAPAPAPAAPAPAAPAQGVFMASTPLFHVTACNCVLHPATMTGGRLVLMHKWNPGRALELIERERVTNFSGVPTMSREMLMHPDWSRRDTSSLVGMGGGGAALQPDLVAKIDSALTKGAPVTGYGLTETTGIVTASSARRYLDKPASAGPIVPTLEAKLVDENGVDIPTSPDAVGELCVRGSVIIKGYLNRPEATAEAIRDGWFHTGDICRIDDEGFVYIVDRAKDMVNRGGENVYCSEVETAIYQHDAVAEAAVFGIPDDRLGEAVAAAIVLRPGSSLTTPELDRFLAAKLAAYKIPATVWFLSEPLPRNANGKFVKRELRDRLLTT